MFLDRDTLFSRLAGDCVLICSNVKCPFTMQFGFAVQIRECKKKGVSLVHACVFESSRRSNF